MTKLFFQDINGNLWLAEKTIGFVKDETQDEPHFLVILEGGINTEISRELYLELTKAVAILTANEVVEPENADE